MSLDFDFNTLPQIGNGEVLEPELIFSPVWVFRAIPKMDVKFHARRESKRSLF